MRRLGMRGFAVGGLILGCLAAAAAEPGPPWRVGDTWQVGVWQGQAFVRPDTRAAASQGAYNPRGRMIAVTFEVADTTTIAGTECFRIQVTFPREATGFQRRYQACYAKGTARLLRITDVSLTPAGTAKDTTTTFAAGSGPTLVTDIASLVPFDWPDWTQANVEPSTDGTRHVSQTTTHRAAPSDGRGSQDEITLTVRVGQKEISVVQTWNKDQPWWSQARKYDGQKLVSEAVLLEVNGRKIANASG